MLPVEDGEFTLPSVVAYKPDGGVLVGRAAQRYALSHPSSVLSSTKRLMGKSWEGASADADAQPALPPLDDWAGFRLPGAPPVTPQAVASEVLRRLLSAAARATCDAPPTRAVVSVPAYFDEAARGATLAAARGAGLEGVHLVHEPVAAGLAYGLDLGSQQTVLVVDLGGGTLDVSLLEVGGGAVEVLSTAGDAALGGDDWDAELARWLAAQARRTGARLDLGDPGVQARLRRAAREAKVRLSSCPAVDVGVPGVDARFRLTAQAFDGMTKHLYRRARETLDKACWQAGFDLEEVRSAAQHAQRKGRGGRRARQASEGAGLQPRGAHAPVTQVLLVGGATRMPGLRRFVKNMTGLEAEEHAVDPDLAVAAGAAICAGMRDGSMGDLMVLDVWQAALMRALAAKNVP